MSEVSKPVSPPLVTIKVIVHLSDERSLVESLELPPEDIQPPEEVVFHIWEDTPNE